MDKIFIKNLELYAYHGVNPEEKENGQRFFLDITAAADLREAGLSDDLSRTVSYAKIIKTASAVFCAEKNDLIERAAERVADALLTLDSNLVDQFRGFKGIFDRLGYIEGQGLAIFQNAVKFIRGKEL